MSHIHCFILRVLFIYLFLLFHWYWNMEANLLYLNLSSLILIRLHPWININFCSLLYSILLLLPKGVQFYFIFLFPVTSKGSANRNEKHPHSTLEKFSDSYCYGPFRPFEAILLNTGQSSRSNRYANTIAANVLCFTVFLFLIFTCFL